MFLVCFVVQHSACEACRFFNFSFESFIAPTLIYKFCLQLSLYRFIINKQRSVNSKHYRSADVRPGSKAWYCFVTPKDPKLSLGTCTKAPELAPRLIDKTHLFLKQILITRWLPWDIPLPCQTRDKSDPHHLKDRLIRFRGGLCKKTFRTSRMTTSVLRKTPFTIGMTSCQDTVMWTKGTLMSLGCGDSSMVALDLEAE